MNDGIPVANLFIDMLALVKKHRETMDPGELLSVMIGTSAFLAATAGFSREEIISHMDDTLNNKEELEVFLSGGVTPFAQA